MKHIVTLITSLITASFAFGGPETRTITFESPAFELGQTSDGINWGTTFTFQIGSFGSFTPTASNLDNWDSNFQSLATTQWQDFGNFSGSATLSDNSAGFATTNNAYIWGYNTKTIGLNTEWILLTNDSWKFPDTNIFSIAPSQFTTTDAGTYGIIGQLASSVSYGVEPYMISDRVSTIPEPSTYAAIFGALTLGGVCYRRYRRK
jgi:hypothetical protein